ncbi:uncharacterized protein LOC143153905 [Ptiloglossa arizonensis]|uniref:uncharacterized protein LOC143153905 n=1 Tax=Ptiloglossa arizonensis TaxID=3350558 RepID=UPI003FA0119F
MSISMIALLMIASITGCIADEEDERSSRVPQIIPYIRGWKVPQDGGGYEQCRPTRLWKGLLGYVNVFAFLDPSWHYSYRQAIMLELLKKQLERSNFSNIMFFVVTPPTHLPEDSLETKTWKDISRKNIVQPESFWEGTQSEDQAKSSRKGFKIIFLRDTPDLGIWENFHAFKDEVAVIDRCGKLTYQVIIPWSILYFPYVKAAILSTYKEEPCGPCEEQPSSMYNIMDYEQYLFQNVNPNEEEVDQNFDSYAKETLANLESESVTVFAEESKETVNDRNASTVVPSDSNLNTNDITVPGVAITGLPPTKVKAFDKFNGTDQSAGTATTENMKNDKTVEDREKVSLDQEQTQTSSVILETTENYSKIEDQSSSNEQTNANNNVIIGINTDATRSNDVRQNVMDESLKTGKEKEIPSVDYETLTPGIENKEIQVQKDTDLPLRIILYAPHLHQEGQTIKQYTHLVLKTGSPDYHEHFHSMGNVYGQQSIVPERSDTTILNKKKLGKFVSGINESPGLYGEISDYWRNTEDDEFNDRSESIAFLEQDDAMHKDTKSDIINTFDIESNIVKPSFMNEAESDTSIKSDADSEDFMQRRLIEHYSKLVPWIYYIL